MKFLWKKSCQFEGKIRLAQPSPCRILAPRPTETILDRTSTVSNEPKNTKTFVSLHSQTVSRPCLGPYWVKTFVSLYGPRPYLDHALTVSTEITSFDHVFILLYRPGRGLRLRHIILHVIRRRFAAALLPRLFGTKVPGHTTRAPPVVFEPTVSSSMPLPTWTRHI